MKNYSIQNKIIYNLEIIKDIDSYFKLGENQRLNYSKIINYAIKSLYLIYTRAKKSSLKSQFYFLPEVQASNNLITRKETTIFFKNYERKKQYLEIRKAFFTLAKIENKKSSKAIFNNYLFAFTFSRFKNNKTAFLRDFVKEKRNFFSIN